MPLLYFCVPNIYIFVALITLNFLAFCKQAIYIYIYATAKFILVYVSSKFTRVFLEKSSGGGLEPFFPEITIEFFITSVNSFSKQI